MAPKKAKIRKRPSTDEDDYDTERTKTDSSGEVTDLLSPSEVVKMRKKTKPSHDTPISKDSKEKDMKSSTKVKSSRVLERNSKKENDKKKDTMKPKKEKSEKDIESRKASKVLKEKEKKHMKKKMKNEGSDSELLPVPILYPCGICTKEVSDADDAILCEAGCEYWYHRNCTGMTDIAYQLLTNEDNAEWVCDKCIATKSVPLCKLKGE